MTQTEPDKHYQRFHVKRFEKSKTIAELNEESYNINSLIINILPDGIFKDLCSLSPNPIKHNCSRIPNLAPSLEQLYQEFKIYNTDLNIPTDNIHKRSKTFLRQFDPSDTFYTNTNNQFITARSATYFKQSANSSVYKNRIPVYWFNNGNKYTITEAKRSYAKLYESKTIETDIFKILADQVRLNPDLEVMIYSNGANNLFQSFQNQSDLIEFFKNDKFDFPDCYCLLEMLTHHSHMEQCLWNNPTSLV